MTRRRTAAELERTAARRRPPRRRGGARAATRALVPAGGEALAMLVRRGLRPRPTPPDVPFPDIAGDAADRLAERFHHYAFRLLLRGAMLAPGPFLPEEATRYVSAAQARTIAEDLVALGLAVRAPGERYRLLKRAPNFGGALEWWVGRELGRRLACDVVTGVRSGARGVGGDLDVVAAAEGKLLYLELKSSPPKHVSTAEVTAFLRRLRSLRPDLAVFVVDTALRLGDKILPMLAAGLARHGAAPARPRRVLRDVWCIAPRLYAASARQDLIENVCAAVADGLVQASPDPFGSAGGDER